MQRRSLKRKEYLPVLWYEQWMVCCPKRIPVSRNGRGAGLKQGAAFRAGAETLAILRTLQRGGQGRSSTVRELVTRLQDLLGQIYRYERG